MQGSLVCVGVGMTLGAHISPICRSHIEQADVVFSGVSHGLVEMWLQKMNTDVRSLQVYYEEGKNRNITYREMVDAMLAEVRDGKKVVGAFYGHPGVFALAPHKAVEQAKSEGFSAQMLPGVSAADCLFADLGIDPGSVGCTHFEASQFMFYQRVIDPSAYLILWQIGLAGDTSISKFSTGEAHRKVLLELLSESYPDNHEVILYEANVLPIEDKRIEKIQLSELLNAELHQHTTLVVPPAISLKRNYKIVERLNLINLKEGDKNELD